MPEMSSMKYSSVYTPTTRNGLRIAPSISNPCLWYSTQPFVGGIYSDYQPLAAYSTK